MHRFIYVNYYFYVSLSLSLFRSNAPNLQFIFANCKVRIKLVSWHGSLWFFFSLASNGCIQRDFRRSLYHRHHRWIAKGFFHVRSNYRSIIRFFWSSKNVTLFKWEFHLCKINWCLNNLCFFFGRCWMFRKLFFSLLFSVLSYYIVYMSRAIHGGKSHFWWHSQTKLKKKLSIKEWIKITN